MMLFSTKLQLQTWSLFDDSASELRTQGVLSAFHTALVLIQTLDAAEKARPFAEYLPDYFLRVCTIAAMLVMKVVHSNYARYIDTEAAKRSFNAVILISRRWIVEDNDLNSRTSKVLSQLWSSLHLAEGTVNHPPSLRIKSRSFASILHDALWTWRDRFGQQSGNGAPPAPSSVVMGSPLSSRTEGADRMSATLARSVASEQLTLSPKTNDLFPQPSGGVQSLVSETVINNPQPSQSLAWSPDFSMLPTMDLDFYPLDFWLAPTQPTQF